MYTMQDIARGSYVVGQNLNKYYDITYRIDRKDRKVGNHLIDRTGWAEQE